MGHGGREVGVCLASSGHMTLALSIDAGSLVLCISLTLTRGDFSCNAEEMCLHVWKADWFRRIG